MSIINEIRLQIRIQAGKVLHEPESIPFEVWGEAYIIQEHVEHLFVTRRIIEDQIDEDLENVYL
jgi:hypothetical protein